MKKRRLFQMGHEIVEFEITYGCPDSSWRYVLNPETDELEQIWGEEFGSSEGDKFERVETLEGRWYEVDNTTMFARRLRFVADAHDFNQMAKPGNRLVGTVRLS